MSVYLEKLAEFSGLLRREGLTVGLRETEDACRLLADWDLTDRETVRCALETVYAKSREEQAAFRRAFDGFFVSVEPSAAATPPRPRRWPAAGRRRSRSCRSTATPLSCGRTSRRSIFAWARTNGGS